MSRNKYNPQRVNQARELVIEQVPLTVAVSQYGIYVYKDRIVCPFHADDNPSCFVSDELKTYHCFGCHAKGTVVEFVRDYERIYGDRENYTQTQAILELAERYDVEIPDLEDKTLLKPKRRERTKREVDTRRVIIKKIEQVEQRARGIKDQELRLTVYNILDRYYFGRLQGEEALRKIKGEMAKDE